MVVNMAQVEGEVPISPQKRKARVKYARAETVAEKALKCEIGKLHTKNRHLEVKLSETLDRLKIARKQIEGYQIKLSVYASRERGKPRTKPDPTLVKLSETERLMALRVVHQYRQAANKELYLTKLKFAIGIDPLTDFAAPESKGGD